MSGGTGASSPSDCTVGLKVEGLKPLISRSFRAANAATCPGPRKRPRAPAFFSLNALESRTGSADVPFFSHKLARGVLVCRLSSCSNIELCSYLVKVVLA